MPLHYLVGLTLLTFFVLIDADGSVSDTKILQSAVSNQVGFNTARVDSSITVTRLLRRTSVTDEEDTEEKAGLSVSAVEKAKTMLTTSKLTPDQLQKKLTRWLKKGKSVDTVFMRLHLHQDGTWLLYNPRFATWVQYADDLSAKNPTKGISAISTLTTVYGDDELYKIIEAAKRVPRTENLATKLQTELMQHWVTTRKDPDDIFRLFNLDKARKNIFSKPEFTSWVKYVDDLNAKHPEEPTSMFSTLTKYFSDGVLLKMTEDAKWYERTKGIATKLESDWLQAGLNSRTTPDKVLINLGLGRASDTLLESLLLSMWVKYMDAFNVRYPNKKTTMIEAFSHTFGDIDVTKMLHAAKKKDWTRNIATELESAQLKMWLNSKKSTDDVFELLQLASYNFRDKPLFNTWISYINFFITENPDKKAKVFSALETRFSDRPMNTILNAASNFPSIESTATKIQTSKIQGYVASNKSPREVFKLLGIDDVGYHVLSTSVFQSWLHYVKDFNKRNPMHKESWYEPLRVGYSWGGVERLIEQALQNPRTVNIGKMVENARLQDWMDRKHPPEHVFQFLHLEKAGEKTLASPKFKVWSKYLNDFNKLYPDQKTTMLNGLRANYNDRALLRMFKAAKNDPSTEKLASDLQNALINKWLADKKKTGRVIPDARWIYREVEIVDEDSYSKWFKPIAHKANNITSGSTIVMV
ncbi:Avirulence protein (Avh) [Phytophthora palmivora]|uniref:Avirulence protein (Avh) n=1 Tax=Phytophthora palmivora TaxID=4796 RepID=A0A2P4Y5Z1_9STRA|nr:Avirulence protein (Avh) [Phytophthora palmivora]